MTADEARRIVADVPDPEIPVVTIAELGILRDVRIEAGTVVVTITPTYSGCPAMDAIRAEIRARLDEHGVADVDVRTVLSPAWTTDWLTDEARRKLSAYGIAPPAPRAAGSPLLQLGVCCPQCGSFDTRERSRFGSTACQSQYVCRSCLEPFDHFKAH